MPKNVLAVVTGIVVWAVLWLGYNAILAHAGILPNGPTDPISTKGLLFLMVGSVVFSIVAGYLCVVVGRRSTYGPVIVFSLIQFAFGVAAEANFWHILPLWYHLIFLALIVPATLLGGWLQMQRVPRTIP